jgi:hypothetical protein
MSSMQPTSAPSMRLQTVPPEHYGGERVAGQSGDAGQNTRPAAHWQTAASDRKRRDMRSMIATWRIRTSRFAEGAAGDP